MYKTLQNLEKQVKEIFALSSSTREIQFKRTRHMEELNNSIKLFKKKIWRWKQIERKMKDKFQNQNNM